MYLGSLRITLSFLVIPFLADPELLARQTGGPASPSAPRCVASAEGMPGSLLNRASAAMGLPADPTRIRRTRQWLHVVNDFQSDRSYPPFFAQYLTIETWYDARTGAQVSRTAGGGYPLTEFPSSPIHTLSSPWAAWVRRDTLVRVTGSGAENRALDPWAVVGDFTRDAPHVRADGRCTYRDYPRVSLVRSGVFGEERLLLDPKTWMPTALLREEPHHLWGQVQVEYIWSNWEDMGDGAAYPLTAFRMVDGALILGVTVTERGFVTPDSAPNLTLPDTSVRGPAVNPAFAQPAAVDTVRVTANTWLLVNPMYTVTVTRQRDTVWVLDATLSEIRARMDADWVARLFPGNLPVTVVVTDLAWPHIGGVRTWVALGAAIVTHRASEAFLRAVLARRWTRTPDLLEQRRARVRPAIRTLSDSLILAGGAVRLYPIDGAATEGALMAWLPGERYLWASDYIQDLRAPTRYAREILRAVRRVGAEPERFAAQHVGLTPWERIETLHPDELPAATRDAADGRALRTGAHTIYAAMERDGRRTERPPRTENLQRIRYRGEEVLAVIRTFDTPTGMAIDSSMFDATTLLPIRHVGVHSSRMMILDFDGHRVTGRYIPQGEPARAIDQTFPARPYDSSVWDLVIAALPLREGYAATVPFYVYEQGGLVWYLARVTGLETVTLHDGSRAEAWALDVQEDGRLRARLWVRREGSREVLRQTAYFGGAAFTTSR